MGKQTSVYKRRWEAVNYKQVKVSLRRELAAAFKTLCEDEGVSVAGEIASFMSERLRRTAEIGEEVCCGRSVLPGNGADDLSSKKKRRAAVKKILSQLEMIMEAQNVALENMPENLQGSEAYENAEESLAMIEEAVDATRALSETY
jgi:hypothetical protein